MNDSPTQLTKDQQVTHWFGLNDLCSTFGVHLIDQPRAHQKRRRRPLVKILHKVPPPQSHNVLTKLELYAVTRGIKAREQIWKDIERLGSLRNDHSACVRHLLRRYGHPNDRPVPRTRAQARGDLQLARDYLRSRLPV